MAAKDNSGFRPQTELVRGGMVRSGFEETSEALYLTSGYVYSSPEEAEAAFKGDVDRFIYSRYGNPTVAMFEERLRLFEGAEFCRGMASGMAAVFASIASQVKAGDRVVASRALFGSCHYIIHDILPRYGVETVLVDGTDLDQWEAALAPGAQCVFLETPSNPTLEIIDLQAVCDLAHAAGANVIVDNVFATPVLQRPMDFGVDIVVYSTTKHIDGQGRCMGGAILGPESFDEDHLKQFMRHTGPSMSPFNAWVMLKGMETLTLRVERHCQNARQVALHLRELPGVKKVIYPSFDDHPQADLVKRQMKGGSNMVAFELEGGKAAAFKALNAMNLIDISNNLGDSKSLITHPSTTTHQRMPEEDRLHLGINDGLLRLSVGLEDADDIKDDLTRALGG
ncbi:MAG: O-succinylhomoserine sulfhydrylase [Alphaproteobacteria bacterium]|jgi:O-succinylhomoserine sulfhydrylase